jgi:hypothetical protein
MPGRNPGHNWHRRCDIPLDQFRQGLAKSGPVALIASLRCLCTRHDITRKKRTGHAIEQDRPDILMQRYAGFDGKRLPGTSGADPGGR